MKNRFPTLHRTTWRSRFVAIARQAEAAPRRPVPGAERTATRVRFAATVQR